MRSFLSGRFDIGIKSKIFRHKLTYGAVVFGGTVKTPTTGRIALKIRLVSC